MLRRSLVQSLCLVFSALMLMASGPCSGSESVDGTPLPATLTDAGPGDADAGEPRADAGGERANTECESDDDCERGERCVENQCAGDEEANECEDACARAGRSAYQPCVDEGGTEDECRARSRRTTAQCIEERCERDEEPRRCRSNDDCDDGERCVENMCQGRDEDMSCEDACTRRARESYQGCVEGGGSEEDCATRVRRLAEQCIADRCGDRPEPQRCRSDEDCERGQECVENLCQGGDEDISCEDACTRRARESYQGCVDGGGSEEDCATRVRRMAEQCIADRCGDGPEPQRCRSDEDCERGQECVENMCQEPEVDQRCADRCRANLGAAFDRCVADGGSEEDCRTRVARMYEQCIADNCGDDGEDDHDGNRCRSNDDCERGQTCVDNQCVAEVRRCRADADCERGERCVENQCVAER